MNNMEKTTQETKTADQRGPLPSLPSLPGSAGPWWFRKSPEHQWRVVEVRNARPEGDPLLYADFDTFRPVLSRLSKRWPRQEWMKINPPNDEAWREDKPEK
jgi:hypothetical protein